MRTGCYELSVETLNKDSNCEIVLHFEESFSAENSNQIGLQPNCEMDVPEGVLIGFGNPLLDIATPAEDSLIEKYDLVVNGVTIAEEKHMALFEELTTQDIVAVTAGGACQNSLRVFQWLLEIPSRAIFVGSVGKDKFGETIAKRARAEGVLTMYQEIDDEPTGACATLFKGQFRSLIANLGAAGCFSDSWLDDEGNMCVMERALFYYATGFFVAVSTPTVLRVAQIANDNNRTFLLNFSATFIVGHHIQALTEIMFFTDILICNKHEALAFAHWSEWNTKDIFEIGTRLMNLPKGNKRPRTVLVTDNVCPVLCFLANGRIIQHPVPKIDPTKIVDTNGCGDAFVGGFLSQLVQNMPIDYCIRMGIFASQKITHVVGVQVDKLPKLKDCCI